MKEITEGGLYSKNTHPQFQLVDNENGIKWKTKIYYSEIFNYNRQQDTCTIYSRQAQSSNN